jgi:hypothetical protein
MNRIVLAFALWCSVGSIAAEKVRIDFEHAGNFSNYKTYRWAEPPAVEPFNQLMAERLTGFVEEALAAKNLKRVQTGGDLLIRLNIQVHEQDQFITFTNGPAFYWDWGSTISTTTVEPILLGVLTVDLVDARQGRLVFQGVSTDSISSRPERNTRRLAKSVNKIFARYPPK